MTIFELYKTNSQGPSSRKPSTFIGYFPANELQKYIAANFSTGKDINWNKIISDTKKVPVGTFYELPIENDPNNDELLICVFKYNADVNDALNLALAEPTDPDTAIPDWAEQEYKSHNKIVDHTHNIIILQGTVIIKIIKSDDSVISGKIILPLKKRLVIAKYYHNKNSTKSFEDLHIKLDFTNPYASADVQRLTNITAVLQKEKINGFNWSIGGRIC